MNRVILATVVVFALSCVAWSSDNVTWTAQAQSVPKLIEALDERTELKLVASDLLRNEIVCLRVVDVPVEELLDRLAVATDCRWRDIKGVLTLEPDPVLRRKQQQEEWALTEEIISEQLREWCESRSNPYFDPSFLDHFPLSDIVRQKPGTVQVYALTPTRRQKALDKRILESVAPSFMVWEYRDKRVDAVDIHVVCTNIGGTIELVFRSMAPSGNDIKETRTSVSVVRRMNKVESQGDPGPEIVILPMESVIAGLMRRLVREDIASMVVARNTQGRIPSEYRDAVTGLLKDPVENEPLSLTVSPVLLRSAEALGKNVIVLLNDDLLSISEQLIGRKSWNARLAFYTLIQSRFDVDESDLWISARSKRPARARTRHIDRGNLKEMIDSIEENGFIIPQQCVRWLPDEFSISTVMFLYLSFFDMQAASMVFQSHLFDFETFRLLSAIPFSNWKWLVPGQVRTIYPVPRLMAKKVEDLIFNSRLRFMSLEKGDEFPVAQFSKDAKAYNVPMNVGKWRDLELTDVFADGLPDVRIQLFQTAEPHVYARNSERGIEVQTSLKDLNSIRSKSTGGSLADNDASVFVADEFLPVMRMTWVIQIEMLDRSYAQKRLTWYSVPDKDAWCSFEDLPDWFTGKTPQ